MRLLLPLLALVLSPACRLAGPGQVPQDQFDYNAAIARSAHEQLLLNLVRLRYHETPVFLTVASVISSPAPARWASSGAERRLRSWMPTSCSTRSI